MYARFRLRAISKRYVVVVGSVAVQVGYACSLVTFGPTLRSITFYGPIEQLILVTMVFFSYYIN